jgi:anti-anti-sigma factor
MCYNVLSECREKPVSISPYFKLVESQSPSVTVIEFNLAPDLDTTVFNDITRDLIDAWPIAPGRSVVVDMTNVRYLGSVMLGLLVNIRQRVKSGRGTLIVAATPSPLLKVIRIANLDRLIQLADSRDEALGLI